MLQAEKEYFDMCSRSKHQKYGRTKITTSRELKGKIAHFSEVKHCPCDDCNIRLRCDIECYQFTRWVKTGKPILT